MDVKMKSGVDPLPDDIVSSSPRSRTDNNSPSNSPSTISLAPKFDDPEVGKISTQRECHLVAPDTYEDAPPIPIYHALASHDDSKEKGEHANKPMVEIANDDGVPIPLEFREMSAMKNAAFNTTPSSGSTSAFGCNNVSSGQASETRSLDNSSSNVDLPSEHDESSGQIIPPNQDRDNGNDTNNPPQNSFGMGSSSRNQQNNNNLPQFYAVEATLVGHSSSSNDEPPQPSAPSVINAVLVNDPSNSNGNDGGPITDRLQPAPDPSQTMSCWKRYQTPLLVGSLVIIAALVGSIVSIVVMGDNGSDTQAIPTVVQETTPTASASESPGVFPLSPDAESILLESTESKSPSSVPVVESSPEDTMIPTQFTTENPSLRPTSPKIIAKTSTDSPTASRQLATPAPNKPSDTPTLRPTFQKPTIATPILPTFFPTASDLLTEAPTSQKNSTNIVDQNPSDGTSLLICSTDNDCASNSCGYDAFSPDASRVCCESNYFSIYTLSSAGWSTTGSKPFCQDRPVGTLCGVTDEICASSACVDGLCADSKTSIGNLCAIDNDCVSDKCGYDAFSTDAMRVCCKKNHFSIYTFSSDGWLTTGSKTFCQDQPVGTLCGVTDEICASGACVEGFCTEFKTAGGDKCDVDNDCVSDRCGFDSFSTDAVRVCCEGNHYSIYTFSNDGWLTTGSKTFCRDRPVGTPCGVTDEICASGACVEGFCAEFKTAGGDECDIDNDCVSDRCGYDSFSTDATRICCEGNHYSIYTFSNDGWLTTGSKTFCRDRTVGTPCGVTDEICASGACVGGICADSKTGIGGECGVDNDCATDKCGYDSFSADATRVCCEGNHYSIYTFSNDGWLTTGSKTFCRDRTVGTPCGVTDEICASGACVGGICADSKTGIGGECGVDNDCATDKCGYDAFSTDATRVCCERNHYSIYTFTSDGWLTTGSKTFCRDQPIGTLCGVTDEICESLACVQGACATEKIGG